MCQEKTDGQGHGERPPKASRMEYTARRGEAYRALFGSGMPPESCHNLPDL